MVITPSPMIIRARGNTSVAMAGVALMIALALPVPLPKIRHSLFQLPLSENLPFFLLYTTYYLYTRISTLHG